jgi:hypothetical protein
MRANKSRGDEIGGTCSTHGRDANAAYNMLVGKTEQKRPLDVDKRIILEWILEKYGRNMRTGFMRLR